MPLVIGVKARFAAEWHHFTRGKSTCEKARNLSKGFRSKSTNTFYFLFKTDLPETKFVHTVIKTL